MEPKTELQRNAIVNARRRELETYQRALDIQWLNNRMEDGRMGRCLALIKKEAAMEKDFQERTDHAAIVNAKAEKETKLGIEIAKISREDACQVLRRQYLREHDPGLRELTKKLQAGYVRRDLQQQILHNEYKRLQDKAEEAHANRILRDAIYNDKEAKTIEEVTTAEMRREYRAELQQQLVNRQQQRHCEYEDKLIEKKMLDDILRTLADEDQRELLQKRELTDKMRSEMLTFQKARDAWKEKQKKIVIMEERKIEEELKTVADRNTAVLQERHRKLQLKEEINKRIATKILTDEAARDERVNIIKQLQEQEYLEKNAQDDILQRQKTVQNKNNTKEALMKQMETRKNQEIENKERELNFRKHVEAKMAAEDAKEKAKQDIQKERAKNYANELKKQIQDNEIKRRREREMEAQRAEAVWGAQRRWDAEVTSERKKIIEEHVPHLVGFLQAGTLGHNDVPALKAGVQQRRMPDLEVDALAVSGRPQRLPKCNEQCRVLREY